MASKKTSTKKAATKPPPSSKSPAAHAPSAHGDSASAKIARHLLGKLSPLPSTTRTALRSLATDVQRSDLGRRTKARGVLAEGVTMAVAIGQAIATFPSLSETYAPTRFAYFLESLLALDALIVGSSARDAKLGAARGAAATKRDHALKARRKLLKRLGRFAGRREAERGALDAVPPQGRTNEDLRLSIEKAVTLAESWLARKDAASIALAEVAALDEAVVATARSAAAALDDANVDAALEGRKKSHDSPIVNLEEGNVLLEMEYAIEVFDEANEDNDVVPRLVPGPATRHVLASSPRAVAEPAPAPPAGTPPPTS